MTVEEVLGRLEFVKKSGEGWTARCPSHDDKHASLSVGAGNDGRTLMKCHAGCSAEAVAAALGLTLADLFERNGDEPPRRPARRAPRFREVDLRGYADALLANEAALQRLGNLRGWTREAVEALGVGLDDGRIVFAYRDAVGALVGVGRYMPNPERRGDGPKLQAAAGSRRELFPAPETTIENDEAFLWLVEGEPDAIRAHSLGLPAVAVPGVEGWRVEYAQRFAGRRVVVCFDCDEPGRAAVRRVAAELASVTDEVRVLDLDPSRGDGYDLSDFTALARTADERGAMRRLLLAAAVHAPRVEPLKPADAAGLLEELAGFLRRYVVMSDVQRDAAALWVAHGHAFEAADATPYLHATSAEKESGKTRLLEALELVVARPLKTGGTTAAALARAVAQKPPPTMLLDESDNAFRRDREYVAALMGILNDGYRRGGRTLLCLPPKWEPSFLAVFAPKALAGIGELPDTVASRSIRIELKRRAPGEHVERFRRRRAEGEATSLYDRMAVWAAEHVETLADARPAIPDELGDRAADVWEPLLAIADLAGGGWPERARRAAVELSAGKRADDDSVGVRLLADIRRAFDERGLDRLATSELLEALRADEEAPWADWSGKPLSARVLGDKLKPYGVRSRSVRLDDGSTPKGYRREQFEDAWSRYLPQEEARKRHTATTRVGKGIAAVSDPPQDAVVADTKTAGNPHGSAVVADVADPGPLPGDRGSRANLTRGWPGASGPA